MRLLGCSLKLIIAVSLCAVSVFGQTAPNGPQMSEQVFKNVTVLKGIPVDQFMDTMGMFFRLPYPHVQRLPCRAESGELGKICR